MGSSETPGFCPRRRPGEGGFISRMLWGPGGRTEAEEGAQDMSPICLQMVGLTNTKDGSRACLDVFLPARATTPSCSQLSLLGTALAKWE